MEKTRTVPKVKYPKEKAQLDTRTEAALMQTGRIPLSPDQRDLIRRIARIYDLPITGITLLAGRPYVNVTGLDDKIQRKWLDNGWIKEELATPIQRPNKENDYLGGYKTRIDMFNQQAFTEALKAVATNSKAITPEIIQALRNAYTVRYEWEGWASPDTCEGIAYKYEGPTGQKKPTKLLVENVTMMAERKSSNRTKRAAVGCGLTSVEEVIGVDSGAVDVPYEVGKEEKKEKKQEELFKGKEEKEQ